LKEFNQLSDCFGFYEEVQGYVDPKINEAKYLRENAILKKGSNDIQPGTFTSRANASNVLHSSNKAFLILLHLNQKLFERLAISKSTTNTPDHTGGDVTSANSGPLLTAKSNLRELPKTVFWQLHRATVPSRHIFNINTIRNERHLSNTEKFYHLKTFLADEAANLVRHLAVSSSTPR